MATNWMNAKNPQPGEHIDTVLGEILDELQSLAATDDLSNDWPGQLAEATQAIKNIIEKERTRAKIEELGNLQVNRQGMISSKDLSRRMEELRHGQ